jgi:hypothetical protein
MSTKSEIEAQLPERYTTYYKPAKVGAIGAVGHWMIVGPMGQSDRVTTPEQVPAALARIEAALNRPAPSPVASPVPAPVAPTRTAAPRARRCEHSDTDNHGICYSCGAYIAGADAGRTMRRYGITR